MNKAIVGFLAVFMTVTSVVVPLASAATLPFSDLKDERFFEYILNLYDDGIVNGKDGKFNPEGFATRGEAVKMVMKSQGIPENLTCSVYQDINPDHSLLTFAQSYRCNRIGASAELDNFRIDEYITRAEIAEFLYGALEFNGVAVNINVTSSFSDVELSNNYYNEIAFFSKAMTLKDKTKIFGGYSDGTFRPNQPITRQELSKVLDLARQPLV